MADETALVQEARSGQSKALAQLLQDNYRMVLGYFMKITLHNQPLAEDLTQETMIQAIEKFRLYDPKYKFSTWLITMGTNIFRDQLRRQKIAAKSSVEYWEAQQADQELDLELSNDLRAALGGLPEEKRITLVLKYFYDYSYEEIAAIIKVPVGTVRSRLHNGIHDLQKVLEEQ
ncbi:MAG TPA: sigma-70 family RNA polymerase sigma factor [Bacillota bacterium]|nr:sigma-70 family RNA polymerase sigma factor [Bacillota bacterium]